MKYLALIALTLAIAVAVKQDIKLGKQRNLTLIESPKGTTAPAAKDTKTDDKKDDKAGQVTTDKDGNQMITVKKDDTVTIQLTEPVNSKKLTWEIIEYELGYNTIWTLQEDSFTLNEDGKSGVR